MRSGTVRGELPFTSHRLQNSYVIMQAIYEDNHLIVVNKESGEIVSTTSPATCFWALSTASTAP